MDRKLGKVAAKFREVGLWNLIAWGQAILATIDGATYFVRGNRAATGTSFNVLRQTPFGLHGYGVAMLAFAGFIIYSSAKPGRMAERVQYALFVFGVLISVSIVTSWVQSHQYQTNGISKWFFLTWVGLTLSITATKNRRVTPDKE